MVGTILGGMALLVALGALWFAGEASKKSEFQQHQFYDAHVKGLRALAQETAKSVQVLIGKVEKLGDGNSTDDEIEELANRMNLIEERLSKLGGAVEQLGAAIAAAKGAG